MMKRLWLFKRVMLIALSLLSGCAADNRLQQAESLVRGSGLQREQIDTGRFLLTAWVRIRQPDAPLHLYIEGDGFAWVTRNQPSQDPTPKNPTGLQLALADPSDNVAYLARPCQFTPLPQNPACQPDYWLGKRFSPEVISAMDRAVNVLAQRLSAPEHIVLTGYSGGSAVAALLAARRTDITMLRTVAGNLDHDRVNQLHHVSPMPDSLNAIDVAAQLSALPQIHFSGSKDTVVPEEVARHFVQKTGTRCASVVTVPGLKHSGDWAAVWPRLMAIKPPC